MTGELGARPVEALRHHGQKGGCMRRLQLPFLDPGLDRLGDAEPGPEGLRHVHDPEREAGLDGDAAGARSAGGARSATRVPQDPPDARDQPLQGRSVELVLAAEAVDHAGLDMALFGMAPVLGQGEVAHHRAVLVPSLRGSEIHAHTIGVYATWSKRSTVNRVPTGLRPASGCPNRKAKQHQRPPVAATLQMCPQTANSGQSKDIDLVPIEAGTYPLECSHLLHAVIFGMTGETVVE